MSRLIAVVSLFIALILAFILGASLSLTPEIDRVAPPPDFSEIPAGEARKQAFYDYFVPLIKQENQRILADRARLEALIEKGTANTAERAWLARLAEHYDFEADLEDTADWARLLRRVDGIPPSLAIAQAANESAWGTSRFAVDGNNYFGQWCFVEGCGLVPTSRPEGARHEVAAFRSPAHSVQRYMNNINSHFAYEELRALRARLRAEGKALTGLALSPTLMRYSERGIEYIEELQAMIRFNKLQRFDELSSLKSE
ncbi:MAG: glucosaminidase domain-containing protein [Saccharospirillum sp.]|nr:glucosaminidase domain-containing protein [Saccharospirillum sp.]